MRHAEDVIIKPIMTEKSYSEIANGKYTFEVALNSSKVEIKNAVEVNWLETKLWVELQGGIMYLLYESSHYFLKPYSYQNMKEQYYVQNNIV